MLFRKGSAHSNHGTDYAYRVRVVVELIRKRYSKEVPIIICADSGFADQKAFSCFEDELHIHYITTSRLYKDVRNYAELIKTDAYGEFTNGKVVWRYFEFANKLTSWKKFRRSIFTTLSCDEQGQYLMGIDKTDCLIYTNIGNNKIADERLRAAGGENFFETSAIIQLSHKRGADELIHRSIKEMATKEQLPFKKFGMNRAYYFLLVISHFIFEAYKRDVTVGTIPISVYPNTFRRRLIDFAVKITSGGRNVFLNVTRDIYETYKLDDIWQKCQSPPVIQFA
ncbi:MAG: transposase [Salinivirgaceae bacterium]|nr:transposase [Salinivirgaceae bacterium]